VKRKPEIEIILETIPVPLLIIDSEKKVLAVNDNFCQKFGFKRSEVNGILFSDLCRGQWNIKSLLEMIDRTLIDKVEFDTFEMECLGPNGERKTMLVSSKYFGLLEPQARGAILTIEETTQLRIANVKAKSYEEKYLNLVNNVFDGVMSVRHDFTIDFANQALEKMFGYDSGELLDKNFEILILEKDRDKHRVNHLRYHLVPEKRSYLNNLEIYGRRKDGSSIPLNITLSPVTSDPNIFVVCNVRDMTESKRLTEDLKNLVQLEKTLRDSAENSNRIKDDFLATLSHELRTPLATILGWAQVLRTKLSDSKAVEHGLSVIERSAQVQGQLINDLLDVSRINSGKISLDPKLIDLFQVLECTLGALESLAKKKALSIEVRPFLERFLIFADSTRMQQVFWNILTNAVKFTPSGGKISIWGETCDSPQGQIVQIRIRDTGVGIKPEFLPRIFERFVQVDNSSTRAFGGIGLGLSIVKSLIELQKGTVSVESEGLGLGTTFTISLPRVVEKTQEPVEIFGEDKSNNSSVRLDGLKVLTVDDNEDNRFLISSVLKSLGADVEVADSVEQGLRVYEEFKPDILLSDISMPGEDGYCFLRKIWNLQAEGKKIPIVALTAYAAPEDIDRILSAGFSAHVAKPVNISHLSHTIAKLSRI
jgi:PAS domain S-box-containing protein